MPQPIRLLHLSDIHFRTGTAWDADPVLRALRGFIAAQIKAGLDPDLVVITGDLTHAGKAAEYALARTWLESLWSTLNQDRSEPLPRNHLLLVPGNHDVDRDRIRGGVRSIQDGLLDKQSQEAVAELLMNDQGEREIVLKRHCDYLDFYGAWLGEPQPLPWWQRTIQIHGQRLHVAGLDSAWMACGDTDRSRLLLGRYQVNQTVQHPDSEDADWRCALLHHPWDYLAEFDTHESRQIIHLQRDLVLRGHLHEGEARHVLSQDPARACLELTAGSVYDGSRHLNAFQWIELSPESRKVRVLFRAWVKGAWSVDRNQPSCPDGETTFDLGATPAHQRTAPAAMPHIDRIRRAADTVARNWAAKTKGYPLIDLTAVRVKRSGEESRDMLSLEQIEQILLQNGRIVLEGPAGRGKTTTLVQLAQRARTVSIAFIVELPAWTSSGRGILEYIAGMPAFLAENLTSADLARVQQTEPFLLLLNGWNQIAASSFTQADHALRELERDFPSAGIIVATRTHHLTPLPGALRLRLLRLLRGQRDTYLATRLGPNCAELRARIDADPSLDELTRTPFILAEVASLFEAGAAIPSTKMGVLAQVRRLQEQRDEHRNALQAAPIFGCQTDYLTNLATEMTHCGAVALREADARAVAAAVARKLPDLGQIEAPAVLATLTAHHVLERVDYPQPAFQFEHQQLLEYYAALDVRAQLLDLRDDVHDAICRFTADYVNHPTWGEPLRMIAEALAEQTADEGASKRNIQTGAKLVEMALVVDLVFAGELVQLCGEDIWNEVRATVGERLRAVYAISDDNYREYALAAMLATGKDDFSDIIVPLLSGQDQQVRLRTYRLWPEFHVSSIGVDWYDQVRNWNDDARVDFVSELLHQRVDDEVVALAAGDDNSAVKEAAASLLAWFGSDDALTGVLQSMDAKTFEDFARASADEMPAALRPKTVAAMRNFIESTENVTARLATALALSDLGETGLNEIVKDAMAALPGGDVRNLSLRYIRSALEYLYKADPAWASEWALVQIAAGVLDGHEYLLPFATAIPDGPVEEYLRRLGADVFESAGVKCISTAISARADARLAAGIFAKVRELRRTENAQPGHWNESERDVMRQLEEVFRRLPDDVAATGILACVTSGDPLDITVAADLLSRVARQEDEPLRLADDNLRARLRAYLRGSIELVLRQDDFTGEEKANLASSIAEIGEPEDMADLVKLIRADIDRMRRGQVARAAGDDGPLGNGGSSNYSRWHIAAVMHLDPAGAEPVLVDLLAEPEYLADVAVAMAREFTPTIRYDAMWAARGGRTPPRANDQRRMRFAAALNREIERLREQSQHGKPATGLRQLARALAAIDGRDAAQVVLEVIAIPGQWDEYIRLESAELLLMAGVVLPVTTAFVVVDSILKRSEKWLEDSDKRLVLRILGLWPFFDDRVAGFSRLRDMLDKWKLSGGELRGLIASLGESRSDAAVDLLCELASDSRTLEQCANEVFNALAAVDTPRARELLLGFVDPDIRGIPLTHRPHRWDVLVARLTELARRRPEAAARLQELCERDLPELSRDVLSKVMNLLGTPEALSASLNLIDDTKPIPVPQGTWDQLKSAFVEQRQDDQYQNAFTIHGRASNEVRSRLFKMAIEDEKRWKSAFALLGQIEQWRLEHGRPTGEPRHPDLASGESWPPKEP